MLNPWRHQAVVEAARRRNRESTYTQPLGLDVAAADDRDLKALQSFLKEFYPTFYSREAKATRTAKLEEFPEVAMYHRSLVPKVVTIEEFWQRYEYRCNEANIMAEWDRHPARGRQVMGEAMSSWFTTKTTWLDSQMKSVKTIVTDATASAAVTAPTKLPAITDSEETIEFNEGEDHTPPPSRETQSKQPKQPLKESSSNNNTTTAEVQSKKQPYIPPHKRKVEQQPNAKQQPYVPPLKRKNDDSTRNNKRDNRDDSNYYDKQATAYVPPHRRRRGQNNSTSSVQQPEPTINAAKKTPERKSKQEEEGGTNNPNQTTTTSSPMVTKGLNDETTGSSKTRTETKTSESNFPRKKKHSLLLCLVVVAFLPFIPRLVGLELSLCDSSTLAIDNSKSSWAQTLLCPATESTSLAVEPFSFVDSKKTRKTHMPKQDKKRKSHNMHRQSNKDRSSTAAAANTIGLDNNYSGGGGPLYAQDDGSDGGGGGLVQSLISSWMQNTDMEQFTKSAAASVDMAQMENAYGTMESSPQKKKKRGGLIGFFQRRFGRKRNRNQSQALATPSSSSSMSQPQMVIHQHIHHVVHHVVHEVRQS